ncbi:MAG: hypothetical protein ACRCZZ_06995 [Phocaeicola sp.]
MRNKQIDKIEWNLVVGIKYSVVALLLMLPICGFGQTVESSSKEATPSFDAVKYALQKQYKAPDAPFLKERFSDNLFFSVSGSFEGVSSDYNPYKIGGGVQLSVGKWFSRYHAARFMFGFTSNEQALAPSLKRYALQLDHLFNLSAFTMGYQPQRTFEVLTVAGVGLQTSQLDQSNQVAADLHLGLQFKIRSTSRLHFFVEPLFTATSQSILQLSAADDRYIFGYSARVGMSYTLGERRSVDNNHHFPLGENSFLNASAGIQLPLSGLEGSGVGPSFHLAIGKWVTPYLAFRLGINSATNTWHWANYKDDPERGTSFYQCYEASTYLGGRLELMINPLPFFGLAVDESRFQLRLLGGGELGYMKKTNEKKPIGTNYSGFSTGLQLGYVVDDNSLIYLEPRFSWLTYSLPYQDINASKKFTDPLFSLHLGVEFGRPATALYRLNQNNKKHFIPTFFASLAGGGNLPFQDKRYQGKNYFDYHGSGTVGYRFTPLSALALTGDMNRVTLDFETRTRQFNLASLALDYYFNLSNLFRGYSPTHRTDFELFAGIVGSYRINAKGSSQAMPSAFSEEEKQLLQANNRFGDNFFIGGEVGGKVSFYLTPKLSLVALPAMRFYGNSMFRSPDGSNESRFHPIFTFQAGISYQFKAQ